MAPQLQCQRFDAVKIPRWGIVLDHLALEHRLRRLMRWGFPTSHVPTEDRSPNWISSLWARNYLGFFKQIISAVLAVFLFSNMAFEKTPEGSTFEANFSDADCIEETRLIQGNQLTDDYANGHDSSCTQFSKTSHNGKKKVSSFRRWMVLCRKALLVTVVLCLATELIVKLLYAIQQTRSCSCGTSIAEALSKKCVFDPLVPGWVPPHCRDDELTEEFRHQVRLLQILKYLSHQQAAG